ncbi:pentapeptide repeat-containing protein [Amycolatopsis sp. NPDC059027]|uniref:pentapeptide repeat-containing protein n=1 Tax=Amycolatopsis sp. NPDC059027 TaxID=3346709 RepID=UPI00366EC615
MERPEPDWPTCDQVDEQGEPCVGFRAEDIGRCLNHLTPEQLDRFLSRLSPGAPLAAPGTRLLPEWWDRILAVTQFSLGDVDVRWARFPGWVSFVDAKFTGEAKFSHATFEQSPSFDRAEFSREARFDGVDFRVGASFAKAKFNEKAEFQAGSFGGHGVFTEASFDGEVIFDQARAFNSLVFDKATFDLGERQRLLLDAADLSFDLATFKNPVVLEIKAGTVSCVATRFEGSTTVQLRNTAATMDRAVFTAPSSITAAPATPAVDRYEPGLFSLRDVDVSNLTIIDVDLRVCAFGGALHLDKLRLEGDCRFGEPPPGIHVGRAWFPVWRWTWRAVIAEEAVWRATTAKGIGWADYGPALNAKRIANLYRQLRKAREDSKDEPGAADFYYGEMEMRRNDRLASLAERAILTLYWATSGYGLRASRAFVFLVVLLLLSGFFFQHFGIIGVSLSYGDGLLDVIGSAMGLDVVKPETLSRPGHILRMLVRIGSPLFLGLALLAVRNRVKR